MTVADVTGRNRQSLRALARAIALSQGQFSLILVRCNYTVLQGKVVGSLQGELQNYGEMPPLQKLVLPPSVTALYTTIQREIADRSPGALVVFGLEGVARQEELLYSSNQVRDEFRKRLPFPVVLWLTEELLQKTHRLAPDFASWAAKPLRFEMDTPDLLAGLHRRAENLFERTACPEQVPAGDRLELEFLLRDLQVRGVTLDPESEACFRFIEGCEASDREAFEEGLQNYKKSLLAWPRVAAGVFLGKMERRQLFRRAIVLYRAGTSACELAERWQDSRANDLQDARHFFQEAIELCDRLDRLDLTARFAGYLEEVLFRLQAWDALEALCKKAIALPGRKETPVRFARDLSYLARVALHRKHWAAANRQALEALEILENAPASGLSLLLGQICQMLRVEAWQRAGKRDEAEKLLQECAGSLETTLHRAKILVVLAKEERWLPRRYTSLLAMLRSLYFARKRYREAFRLKQEKQAIEKQYGLRAFIGTLAIASRHEDIAPEIVDSGRLQDIEQLVAMLQRSDRQTIAVHGPSGVGKSSALNAGLIPALKQRLFGSRTAIPILVRGYRSWAGTIARGFAEATGESQPASLQETLDGFQGTTQRDRAIVLVFDQFEQFFFTCCRPEEKKAFYDFLERSLRLPGVKAVFSLREDYLHYLLEVERAIDGDENLDRNLLARQVRYYLGNFSPESARKLVWQLTERSRFQLEPELVEAFVGDLSAESGEVRPIELQIVGAQLQAGQMTTLEAYQQAGAKSGLLERFLEEAIADCGAEQQEAARGTLYALTDEWSNRPIKARSELDEELGAEAARLDLVLEIFARSGLIAEEPARESTPQERGCGPRYQLVHDYVARLIRDRYQENLQRELDRLQQQTEALRQELQKLQQKDAQTSTRLHRLHQERQLAAELADARYQLVHNYLTNLLPDRGESLTSLTAIARVRQEELGRVLQERLQQERHLALELAVAREKQNRSERWRRRWQAGLAFSTLLLAGLAAIATNAWQDAERARGQAEIAEIRARNSELQARLFARSGDLEALQSSLQAVRKLSRTKVPAELARMTEMQLAQTLYATRETNRLQGHREGIYNVAFAPDGERIATASADGTVKLWERSGKLRQTLQGERQRASSVAFSPDGNVLAVAGWNGTIELWNAAGEKQIALQSGNDRALSVAFSPDGRLLAATGSNGAIALWDARGARVRSWAGHDKPATSIRFSPDGNTIATAGTDRTVRLWSPDGELLQTLEGHETDITGVAFHPNEPWLASAGADGTARLWSLDGTLLQTIEAHNGWTFGVAFSPDGRAIATAGADSTVKLWSLGGTLLHTFGGHRDWVSGVAFDPQGILLASASRDATVKLWRWQLEPHLFFSAWEDGRPLTEVAIAPDGKRTATADEDGNIYLWNENGVLERKIETLDRLTVALHFSRDGRQLLSVGTKGIVAFHDLEADNSAGNNADNNAGNNLENDGSAGENSTGSAPNEEPISEKTILAAHLRPDGKEIALAGRDGKVRLVDRAGRLQQEIEAHTEAVTSVRYAPDGSWFATAGHDSTVKLWSRDGTLLQTLEGHTDWVLSVAIAPDGKTLASSGTDRQIVFWRRQDGRKQHQIDAAHGARIYDIHFHPDGERLASASEDGTVKLWQTSGELLWELPAHQGAAYRVRFAPDGDRVVSVGADGRGVFWNASATPDDLLAAGCDRLHDYLQTHPDATLVDGAGCR